jgi:hypothetical protein
MAREVSSQQEKLKDYLVFQIHRNIVNLYKNHLILLEDINIEHQQMVKKLEKHVPAEVLKDVDYLSKDKYNYFRKKTLDVGNEAVREFERSVENITITLK